MQKDEIEVLSDETNFAVVRMPGRQYPGIVVQGDSLLFLTGHAKDAYERAKKIGDEKLVFRTGNILAKLEEYLEHYSNICRDSGD
jgi:hypothetical protein